MYFFKLLKMFVLGTVFNSEDEYNPNSHKFNPVKIIVFVFLIASLLFNVRLLYRIDKVYKDVVNNCPQIVKKLDNS
jgi:hypothetical protein